MKHLSRVRWSRVDRAQLCKHAVSVNAAFHCGGSTYGTKELGDTDHHDVDNDRDVFGAPIPNAARGIRGSSPPPPSNLAPKAELTRPLQPSEGVARAIALFDFNAVQSGDLSFKKGQVIIVTEMSDNTDTWYNCFVDRL